VIQRQKRSAKGELVFTSFLFVAGIVVLWDASQLPELNMADFTGTRLFPSIIGSLLLFFSGIQLIQVLRGKTADPEGIEGGVSDSKPHWKPFLMILGALLFFALSVQIISFIPAATVLFTVVVYALDTKKTKWYVAIPIALVVSIITFFGFTEGLQVDLPAEVNFNFNTSDVVIVEEDW
jgi:putative tricarboxylic transport membrane protein